MLIILEEKKIENFQIYCLPHEIRAPGNATIGNTPNKSITQSVAKNTLSPRVGRYNCSQNNRILFRHDSRNGEYFTVESCSIFSIRKYTSQKWNAGFLFDRYCYRSQLNGKQWIYFENHDRTKTTTLNCTQFQLRIILCIPHRWMGKKKTNKQTKTLTKFSQAKCII